MMQMMFNVHAYSGNKYAGSQSHNSAEQNSLSSSATSMRPYNTHDLSKITSVQKTSYADSKTVNITRHSYKSEYIPL